MVCKHIRTCYFLSAFPAIPGTRNCTQILLNILRGIKKYLFHRTQIWHKDFTEQSLIIKKIEKPQNLSTCAHNQHQHLVGLATTVLERYRKSACRCLDSAPETKLESQTSFSLWTFHSGQQLSDACWRKAVIKYSFYRPWLFAKHSLEPELPTSSACQCFPRPIPRLRGSAVRPDHTKRSVDVLCCRHTGRLRLSRRLTCRICQTLP